MEKAYKTVLEIILNMCEKDAYPSTATIKLMCETVLNIETESEDADR